MKNKVEAKGKAQLIIDGKTYDLPVLKGSVGPDVIDIRTLYRDAGVFTFDPGFTSTASCESQITYIDGDEGTLLYRGYPIDQLADNSSFLEVAYLLLHGELPSASELETFEYTITRHTMLHDQFDQFFRGYRRDAHPMAVMVGTVGALSAFYHDSTDISDPEARTIASHRMIAKMPTIAARAYKYSIGQPFISPRNELDYSSNFLRMCFAVPAEDYKVSKTLSRAMDKIFILHADHEQNASTSTVRLAGSSGANPFACISSGIASLWGPAHGGANEAADGLRPPGLQELRSAREGDARDLPPGSRRVGHHQRPASGRGHGARAHRAGGRVFRREEALPEHRLLFGHHPAGDGLPHRDVHRAVRPGPHRGLDRPVDRDDRGPEPEDRPSAPDFHRRERARLPAAQQALTSGKI
jgi:hypothetical protein